MLEESTKTRQTQEIQYAPYRLSFYFSSSTCLWRFRLFTFLPARFYPEQSCYPSRTFTWTWSESAHRQSSSPVRRWPHLPDARSVERRCISSLHILEHFAIFHLAMPIHMSLSRFIACSVSTVTTRLCRQFHSRQIIIPLPEISKSILKICLPADALLWRQLRNWLA